MAARPSWQGHLKLSLVTCPVALYNAISPKGDVRFNLINPDTGNRIRMITVDSGTEEPVERKSLVKGFEVAKGEYITVTQEEIDSVRLESTKTIDIESFVPADEIDRLYWDNPYYLVPDGKMAAEPFAVIRAAMEKSGMVALGRLVMSQRERLVALEPRENGIVATMLRSHDEVRGWCGRWHIPGRSERRGQPAAARQPVHRRRPFRQPVLSCGPAASRTRWLSPPPPLAARAGDAAG